MGSPSRDTLFAAGAASAFSLSLGLAAVAMPLLALQAGYSSVEVGLLTAASAVSQVVSRAAVGVMMRRLPDWALIAASAGFLLASNLIITLTAAAVPFVVAELLQGIARAGFWTGSQTHVVRGVGSSVKALATVNLFSNTGMLVGPILAGVLSERSPANALAVATVVAAVAIVPTFLMDRLPPFAVPPGGRQGRMWRRPGVASGCWAAVTAGAWRGVLGSYVPVVLVAAGHSATTVGVLVAVANVSCLVGAALVARLSQSGLATGYFWGTLATGIGLGLSGPAAHLAVVAAVALAISGFGAGGLQTLGPAVASDWVHPDERGDAIATAGTFRAASLLMAPLAMAGLVAVAPIGLAFVVAGVLIAAPSGTARQLRAHLLSVEEGDGIAPVQ